MTVNLDYATVVRDGQTFAEPFVYCDERTDGEGVRNWNHGLEIVRRITRKDFGHDHPPASDNVPIFRIRLEVFSTHGRGLGARSKYRLGYQRLSFDGRFNVCCSDAMVVYRAMKRALKRGRE